MKKYNYVYRILNRLDGKIYIGCHQTDDLDDGYMGSGTLLRCAQRKYGIENFEKEILFQCDSVDEMFRCEAELVDRLFISRNDTYNMCEGGAGGRWSPGRVTNGHKAGKLAYERKTGWHSAEAARNAAIASREWHKTDYAKEVRTRARKQAVAPEAIAKKKETMAQNKHSQGKNNSQFGSMWITNGTDNKKISKDSNIPEGYYRGRKIKIDTHLSGEDY